MHPHRMATAGLIALGAVILLFGLARLFSGSQARSPEGSGDRLQGVLSPSSMGLLMDLKARVAEARRLGEARDRTAVPILAQFSRDSDVQFRKACIRALGEIGDQEGVNALRARMWDDEAEVREETARAFAKLYGETAYKGLSDMVDDKDTRVRLAVAEAFATAVEDKQAIGQLEKMLSDPAREVRFAALRGLCKSPADEASAALIKALKDAEGDIRVAAATEIAGRRGGAACQALGWALGSADAAVRAVAADAIRKIGKPAVPHLKAALTATPSVQARTAAVRLLGEAGGADAAPLLVGMLDGMGQRPDPKEVAELRSAIVDGLSAIGTDAVPTLRDEVMAGERSAFAEEAAAEVCVRIGAPAVPPIVANILKWKVYPDPRELELWIRTLGRIGDPAALEALNFALGQPIAGMDHLVAEARAGIEKKSGTKLPPAAPVRPLPEPAGMDFSRVLSLRRVADAPATVETDRVPDEGVVALTLRRALFQAFGEQRRGGAADLMLFLQRREGKWLDPFWGYAHGLNVRYHPGRVLAYEPGDPMKLKLEVFLMEDTWVPGGYGEYEVSLKRDGTAWSGAYDGHYNYTPVKGDAAADCRKGPIASPDAELVTPGEHPRLLFRVADLPALRARAQTDLGRAILRALLDKIAAGKIEDYAGRTGALTWYGTSDRAVGMGFLAHLFNDREMGARAAKTFMVTVRTVPYQEEHGSPGPISQHGFAYDMAHSFLSPADLREATHNLAGFWGYSSVEHGMLGNMTGGSPPQGYSFIGPDVFVLLREPGPSWVLKPPKEAQRIPEIEADRDLRAPAGLSPNDLGSAAMMTKWLVAGPFPMDADAGVLAHLGGPERARPEKGTKAAFRGTEFPFQPLPPDAIRDTPGFGGKEACIKVPGAGADSRTYLYALLDVKQEQGAYFDWAFPAGFRSARVWFSGVPVEDRVTVLLKPGLHRVMIELVGSCVSPYITAVNAHYRVAQDKKEGWKRDFYQAAMARYEKDGELPGIRRMLTWAVHATRDVLRIHLEESLRSPSHSTGWGNYPMFFANTYAFAAGEPLSRDTPWAFDLRPELIRTLNDACVCYALQLASDPVKPFVVEEFSRRFLPDKLGRLNCRSLVSALANYPLDVKPKVFDESLSTARIDAQRGIYGFSSGFDKGDYSVWVFTRNTMPRHPVHFLPRAGSFRIHASGKELVFNIGVNYDAFVNVENSAGAGPCRVTYQDTDMQDGTAVLALDTSDVYGTVGDAKVSAQRHVAVDLSGRCGAPLLVAVLDRLRAPGRKTWSLPTGVGTFQYGDEFLRGNRSNGPVRVWDVLRTKGETLTRSSKSLFAIGGDRSPTLLGRFVTPAEPQVSFDAHRSKAAWTNMRVISDAEQADYFVVMTVQTGAPPEIKVAGAGLEAVVTVGEQEVRFDGRKLVLKR